VQQPVESARLTADESLLSRIPFFARMRQESVHRWFHSLAQFIPHPTLHNLQSRSTFRNAKQVLISVFKRNVAWNTRKGAYATARLQTSVAYHNFHDELIDAPS
jgi:hypothetical protein